MRKQSSAGISARHWPDINGEMKLGFMGRLFPALLSKAVWQYTADALPDDFAFLSLTGISYSGTAEMIGITEDGRFLLIGTGDGQFIADYIDSQKESVCQDFTVPSHAAVVSVQETEDAFYIHDADGLVWKVPNGRKRITMSGLIGEVKDRYHGDVPEQSAQKRRCRGKDSVGLRLADAGLLGNL